jgi:hypothetical protein
MLIYLEFLQLSGGADDLWRSRSHVQHSRRRRSRILPGCSRLQVRGCGPWLADFRLAAFHPSEGNDGHEFYFLCDDLKAEMATLAKKGVQFSEVEEARWGSITKLQLPGGGQVGLYQPKHPTALGLK